MEYFFLAFMMIHAIVASDPVIRSPLEEFLPPIAEETMIWDTMDFKSICDGQKEKYDEHSAVSKYDNFFLEHDLHPGKNIIIKSPTKAGRVKFLSPSAALKIPFSYENLPDILSYFSFKENSSEAETMKATIKSCEKSPLYGEEKYCSRTLEFFEDAAVAKLGNNIQLLSTDYIQTNEGEFTMGEGIERFEGKNIVCHKISYPHAVFYCHAFHNTVVYKIPLVGKDGTTINSVAVCHQDTSTWNPGYLAFKMVNAKPGVPICHLLRRDGLCLSVVWVANS
ncbi:hypothetical protein PTKIN_Ptkin11bG0172900 [Pterospermum kingtungense]